jgi:hypothetical protein
VTQASGHVQRRVALIVGHRRPGTVSQQQADHATVRATHGVVQWSPASVIDVSRIGAQRQDGAGRDVDPSTDSLEHRCPSVLATLNRLRKTSA